MILSGLKIKEEVEAGNIEISDFSPDRLGPNSYNLRLSNKIYVYNTWEWRQAPGPIGDVVDERYEAPLDMKKKPRALIEREIPERGFQIEPGKIYLGSTIESTYTNKYVPMLEGRSSIGRLGMFIHITAGFGDIGFRGNWTLEIACLQPIIIYPGVEIGQIYYHTICGDHVPYRGKYSDSKGVMPSNIYKDFMEK